MFCVVCHTGGRVRKNWLCLTVEADSLQSSGDTVQLCPLCPKATYPGTHKHTMQQCRGWLQSCKFVLIRVCLAFDALDLIYSIKKSHLTQQTAYTHHPPATSGSRFHYMLIAVCSSERQDGSTTYSQLTKISSGIISMLSPVVQCRSSA